MWDNRLLKADAKNRLRSFYFKSVIVCFIVTVITNTLLRFVPTLDYETIMAYPEKAAELITENFSEYIKMYFLSIGGILCISIFAANPLKVGIRKFFSEATGGKVDFLNLFYAFKSNYINVVRVMFLRDLFVFLMSLLLIVPGVCEAFRLYYIEFILSENPNVTFTEAKNRSVMLTDNVKMKMFVLTLSFLPWIIIGILAFGVGVVLVEPYIYETFELLYRMKKYNSEVNN